MLIAFDIAVNMRIWLILWFFLPITDQLLHICALFSTNLTKNIVSRFKVALYKKGKNYVKRNTLAFEGPFLCITVNFDRIGHKTILISYIISLYQFYTITDFCSILR